MEIKDPAPTQATYDDYDIYLDNGQMMQVALETQAGDTIEFGHETIHVKIQDKPSMVLPDEIVPGHDLTFQLRHVVFWNHQVRTVDLPTREQKEEFRKVLNEYTQPPGSRSH